MVFHTTFSFTHVRPRKRKIDGWEFWENLVRFSEWEDYHKQGLRDAGEGRKNGIGELELETGKEKFQARVG
jgi:hypothetical protein